MYKSPKNNIEYWEIILNNWNEVSRVFDIYLPTFQNQWIDGSSLECSLGDFLIKLKNQQSRRLIRAFHAALWNIPEDRFRFGQEGSEILSIMYDLCVREDQCLNDDGELE